MPAQRFQSMGQEARLGAAIIPVPAQCQMSWSSWGKIVGMPSQSHIPAPAPVPGADTNAVAIAIAGVGAGGMGQPSSAYSFWNPGIYYQPKPPRTQSRMEKYSDNQMPVPAIPPSGKLGYGGYPPSVNPSLELGPKGVLGQRQVGWPITTPYFKWRQSIGG